MIARTAGVSLATVSLALRDSPQTSRATRSRIKALAAELDYRPDPRVAKLMGYLQRRKHRRQTGKLAFLTAFAEPDIWRESVTWTNYFEGARRQAAELGYDLEHFWMRAPNMTEQRLSRIMHSRGIEGLLIAPVPRSHRRMALEWTRFSTVAFGYSLEEPRVHRVVHNHFHTMTLAVETLHRRGFRRIGLVIEPDHDSRVSNLWSAGFLAFKHIASPECAVPLFRRRIEPAPLLQWFRRWRPDAIIGDEFAAVRILRAAGYRVPHDYAFVSVDWDERFRPFAGINQHPRDHGAAAVKQVVSILQRDERGVPARPEVLMVEGSWMDGASVPPGKGAAIIGDPLRADWVDRATWH